MKKIVAYCAFIAFTLFGSLSFAQDLRIGDMMELLALRDGEKINSVIQPRGWNYMSSELKEGTQEDMWMFEKKDHTITGVAINVMNDEDKDPQKNMFRLHVLTLDYYTDLMEQAHDRKFKQVRETVTATGTKLVYYTNGTYLLVVSVDQTRKIPYEFMLSKPKA